MVRDAKKERAERDTLRRRFWTELLEKAAQKTNIHTNAIPSDRYYSTVSSGVPGLYYGYILPLECCPSGAIHLSVRRCRGERAHFRSVACSAGGHRVRLR